MEQILKVTNRYEIFGTKDFLENTYGVAPINDRLAVMKDYAGHLRGQLTEVTTPSLVTPVTPATITSPAITPLLPPTFDDPILAANIRTGRISDPTIGMLNRESFFILRDRTYQYTEPVPTFWQQFKVSREMDIIWGAFLLYGTFQSTEPIPTSTPTKFLALVNSNVRGHREYFLSTVYGGIARFIIDDYSISALAPALTPRNFINEAITDNTEINFRISRATVGGNVLVLAGSRTVQAKARIIKIPPALIRQGKIILPSHRTDVVLVL